MIRAELGLGDCSRDFDATESCQTNAGQDDAGAQRIRWPAEESLLEAEPTEEERAALEHTLVLGTKAWVVLQCAGLRLGPDSPVWRPIEAVNRVRSRLLRALEAATDRGEAETLADEIVEALSAAALALEKTLGPMLAIRAFTLELAFEAVVRATLVVMRRLVDRHF